MNIFGVGGVELLLIIMIMLVIAGPQRMLRWAYVLGTYVAKLRDMWADLMTAVQKEIDAQGIDVQLPKEPPNRQTVNDWLRQTTQNLTKPVETASRDVQQEMNAIKRSASVNLNGTANNAHNPAQTGDDLPVRAPHKRDLQKAQDAQASVPPSNQPASTAQKGTVFGAWGNAMQQATPPSSSTSSKTGLDLGAWGNPSHPAVEAAKALEASHKQAPAQPDDTATASEGKNGQTSVS